MILAFKNTTFLILIRKITTHHNFKAKFDKAVDLFATIFKFLNGVIAEHEKHNDYTMEMEPHDFIDAYMMEMQRSEERGESHYFSKIQLSNIAFDLWFAGKKF